MIQFFSFFIILFILLFLGIVALIVWVVVKSTQKPVGEEARQERTELLNSVLSKRDRLVSWDNYAIENLRPSASYKYIRGITNSFSGRLLADDGQYVLAFKRIERGFQPVGSIAAATTSFELFFINESDRTEFYYDRMKIGTVLKTGGIFDKDGKRIGTVNRSNTSTISIGEILDIHTGSPHYDFTMNGRVLAKFYVTPRISNFFGGSLFSINENSGSRIIQPIEEPREDEKKWLEAWTVYELIYHGFWFNEV
ncbi:hypothetical protein [Fluviicola sp.]|uniref:hypothetical protein n=1 Tax=Fluviicola sp. TaxID=1917219 RepID=UPI0031DD21FD